MNSSLRFQNFILLNSSFTNQIGLCDGKSAIILYLSLSSDKKSAWKEIILFSLLEETISQTSLFSPLPYGTGIAGVGVLLEALSQKGVIEENTNDLLAESEQYLLNAVFYSKTATISIEDGIAGIGLYIVHRLNAANTGSLAHQMRLKESLIACVDQVQRIFHRHKHENNKELENISIFSGYSGVLLFLDKVLKLKYYESKARKLLQEISLNILNQLCNSEFAWANADGWFTIFYIQKSIGNDYPDPSIVEKYKTYLSHALENIESILFQQSAFTALWFRLNFIQICSDQSSILSNLIKDKIDTILNTNCLNVLFPFDKKTESVPMGLCNGVSGTALPLLSLNTGDYSWLSIFGIDTTRYNGKN